MKKISVSILILLFSFGFSDSYSQLANQNTYLLAQINNYPGYSGIWGYVAPDSSEYALLGCFNGTSIVNITDSSNIHEVDFVPGVNSGWRELKTYSHYAYVVSEGTNSKLQILDLQYLPDSVSLIKSWNYSGFTQAHNISQSGPYLYISGGNASPNGGMQIIDITDPVNPVRRGNNTVRYVHDCRVSNDTIWGTNINNQKISIMNGVNKNNVTEIRNFNTLQSMPHNLAFSPDKKYIYVTYENETPGMLDIWNIEDLENIAYIRSWQPSGIETTITHNVEVFGNYAIVAHYTAGIRILDLTNPSNPIEVAWYDTRPQDNSTNFLGCWGVYMFPSGKIIASDIQSGLYVIKTSLNELPPLSLSLKILMEGMYYPIFNQMTRKDTLKVYLKNSTSPYAIVDSTKGVIDSLNFSGLFIFNNVPSGTYFIVVKHINSIETWSKSGGETLINNGSIYTYDFTTSASKAYGNNLKLKGSKYCIYGGNVNGDAIVDGGDLSEVDNDSFAGLAGRFLRSDVNGDNIVDAADVSLVDNNSFNSIVRITP